jgi:hypothetical protein
MSSVRSMGLEPATRPLLRGRVYALRAFDASHMEMRVLVDARSGEVMSARPVADRGPAEEQYNPRYGHYEPPRPPARGAGYTRCRSGQAICRSDVAVTGSEGAAAGARGRHGSRE